MKKETIEKGITILREIDFHVDRADSLASKKKEIQDHGYIKIDSNFWNSVEIPFNVFEKWFDDEIKASLDKAEILQKQLDEL